MMKQILCLLLAGLLSLTLSAQNSKKVKQMKQQQSDLQVKLKKSQTELDRTKKQVQQGQKNVDFLGVQMDNRLSRIRQLEEELDGLDGEIIRLQETLTRLDADIRLRRERLKAAIRYARAQRECNNPLVFVLSAETFSQMYRRARYAREYVSYQHSLGEQILRKQAEQLEAQNRLLSMKSQKNMVLREVMLQRKDLNAQQVQERQKVAGLKKQQTGLQTKVSEQQKQLAALNREIEKQIAYEIEQARKRAEEEARRKAEAARKKAAKSQQQKPGASSAGTSSKSSSSQSAPAGKGQTWLTAEDRQLNGSFEQNKGRLPVPITGQYVVGSRFGIYNVPGMKNVQLDNKGTNYIGKPGARARCVFNGVVTSVFSFGGTQNVLVRHGSYISVYCNLSSVIVSKGQKVKTNDILGSVADEGGGNCNLHFQLRKETTKLNPEAWIGR